MYHMPSTSSVPSYASLTMTGISPIKSHLIQTYRHYLACTILCLFTKNSWNYTLIASTNQQEYVGVAVVVTAAGWCTTTTRNCRALAAVSRLATRSICAADTSPCLCRHARVVLTQTTSRSCDACTGSSSAPNACA